MHKERTDGGRRRIGRRWGRDRDRDRKSGTRTGSQGEINAKSVWEYHRETHHFVC